MKSILRTKGIKEVEREIEESNNAEIEKINFKENFSKIHRGLDTKIVGGGPMFPIPSQYEKYIVDLDQSTN